MKKHTSRTQQLISIISSKYFFVGIVAFFVLQAVWIALSGRYPMAFDEDFHLGIIKLYADHLVPFWNAQPAGSDSFGAITRDPSYLFHYLSAFPYLILRAVTDNEAARVIVLRLLNIALFAAGLILWRKVLLKSGASKAIAHFCLLVLVLLPIVPLMAAQINYDNLFLPVVAISLLLTIKVGQDLAKYKRVDTRSLLVLAITCMLASVIKYAFLPILVAIIAYLAWELWHTHEGSKKLAVSFAFGWTTILRGSKWMILIGLLISTILFGERYLVNMVKYREPIPDCAKVLSVERCMEYSPWARNYTIEHSPAPKNPNPTTYAADWFYGMWLRTFFAVDGPGTNFQTRGPLILPGLTAIVLVVAALIAFAIKARTLWRRYDAHVLSFFVVVILGYVGILWLEGLKTFMKLGDSVAINGRYLLPVALLIFVLGALSINELLKDRRKVKVIVACLAILGLAWGGGASTYILRSNSAWYWSNSTVEQSNQAVRDAFGPVAPGYYNQTKFLWRN